MHREDFVKLVGLEGDAQYVPVAFLLTNGYACAGNYNAAVNEGLVDTCVLLNARVMELGDDDTPTGRPSLGDFCEFLEEVVVDYVQPTSDSEDRPARGDVYGKSIPLTAIPFGQIAVVYPVAHIGALLRRAEPADSHVPRFLDLGRSEILAVLRTKLW